MKVLKIELKRAFCNKYFAISVLIGIIICVYHLFAYVLPSLKQIDFMLEYMESKPLAVNGVPGVFSKWIGMNTNAAKEVYTMVVPMIAAIPFGASLYLDEKNQYINNIATRTNKRNYYVAKFISLFLSGGTVAVIPLILSLLINLCILPIDTPQACTALYLMNVKNVLGDLFYANPFLYVIIFILWVFFLCGLLTTFCFTASYILENRFVIMISPFIIYFSSSVLSGMLGGIPNMRDYIMLNKMRSDSLIQIIVQLGIILLANVGALVIKCSSKKDIL